MNILVLGSGGREHALCWKISKSPKCDSLYCIPGNGGIEKVAICIKINPTNKRQIYLFCKSHKIDLVVIGPEGLLGEGLSDYLTNKKIKVFGPSKKAAKLETSKVFSKAFLKKNSIPTANSYEFNNLESSVDHINLNNAPFVIKVDGLAAGKGVIICTTKKEAVSTLNDIFKKNKFGNAGEKILIEEFLEGYEISYFSFFDKNNFLPFGYALDHKRAKNNDKGLNTGGMGAFSPSKKITASLERKIIKEIVLPTKNGLEKSKIIYRGIIFFGLMITEKGPKVIEYNVRFGDPECQVLMRKLDSDLLNILDAVASDLLYKNLKISLNKDFCICVILASIGYPNEYQTGFEIKDIKNISLKDNIEIFHSGTEKKNNKYLSTGGRVLSITARDKNPNIAKKKVYRALKKINWKNGFYRDDIGVKNYD